MIEGWRYYNHAAIPTCKPHCEPDLTPIINGSIWNAFSEGKPLLARWTSEWDCGIETSWWYVIKDAPYDISLLKSKRRYEINKGNKNFEVRLANPTEMIGDIYRITLAAYSGWPRKYRPHVTMKEIERSVQSWNNCLVFVALSKETQQAQGYAIVKDYGDCAEFSVLRTNPDCESQGINAAMVYGIISEFNQRFGDGFYLCDGARTIRHETSFQDYLEKYFGFRKAYCKLNIKYKKGMRLLVYVLYPLRHIIRTNSRIGSQISAILKMEELRRQDIYNN